MTTDQTIRSTESNRTSPAYQFRLTQTPTDTTFLDLLSTLHQPSPDQRPAALLRADADSKLDERAYVESQRQERDDETIASSEPQSQDSNDDPPQPIICCLWNENSERPVLVEANQSANETIDLVVNESKNPTFAAETTVTNDQTEVAARGLEQTSASTDKVNVADVEAVVASATTGSDSAEKQRLETISSSVQVTETPDQSTKGSATGLTNTSEAVENNELENQSPRSEDDSPFDLEKESEIQEKIQRWTEERRQNSEAGRQDKSGNIEQARATAVKPETKASDAAETTSSDTTRVLDDSVEQEETEAHSEEQQQDPEGESAFGRSRRAKKEGSRIFRPEANQTGDERQVNNDKKLSASTQTKLESARHQLAPDPLADQNVGNGEASNAVKTNQSNTVATQIAASAQGILKDSQTKFTVSANTQVEGTSTTATPNAVVKSEAPLVNNQNQAAAKSTLQRLPPQTINRITSALKEAPNGDSSLRLRLNPVELGSVEIEIAFRNGIMSAKLKAEKGQTQQMLQEGLDSLKTRLAEHGITIESLEVELGSDSSSNSSSGGQTRQEFASGQNRQSSGFFEQQQQRRADTENKTKPTDEPSNKEVDSVGQWAVNVVA